MLKLQDFKNHSVSQMNKITGGDFTQTNYTLDGAGHTDQYNADTGVLYDGDDTYVTDDNGHLVLAS